MFELTHGVYNISVLEKEVGFAIALFNNNIVTIDVLIFDTNNNLSINNRNVTEQVHHPNPTIDTGAQLISILLNRHEHGIEFHITPKRISYIANYFVSSKKVYLTRDYTPLVNKTFVNINNEKYLDYNLNVDFETVENYLNQYEGLR